jgi:hypothetical protein
MDGTTGRQAELQRAAVRREQAMTRAAEMHAADVADIRAADPETPGKNGEARRMAEGQAGILLSQRQEDADQAYRRAVNAILANAKRTR